MIYGSKGGMLTAALHTGLEAMLWVGESSLRAGWITSPFLCTGLILKFSYHEGSTLMDKKWKLEKQSVTNGGPSLRMTVGIHTPWWPPKSTTKDDGLWASVRIQANIWAACFTIMGSILEVHKAECVVIWVCCDKSHPLWAIMNFTADRKSDPTSCSPIVIQIQLLLNFIFLGFTAPHCLICTKFGKVPLDDVHGTWRESATVCLTLSEQNNRLFIASPFLER